MPSDEADAPVVTETVAAQALSREFDVSARGFWQVHPGAAATFVDAVIDGLKPQEGERCLDLYAGVGVFASALAEAVGPSGQVVAVESDAVAVAQARLNVERTPWVHYIQGRVDHVFGVESTGRVAGSRKGRRRSAPRRPHSRLPPTADVVVLDPRAPGPARQSSARSWRCVRVPSPTSRATRPRSGATRHTCRTRVTRSRRCGRSTRSP